ncbi:hypothetical protein GBAR_LOCUS21690 [Geodia barretti]|uniref:Uncharacterized protein n=1 Tax=Geodia barretti TaxID=519541 RepID=A0AA35SZF1_GEOBA|nr:hypothetical protein GBAR_LOCUS21690 [Geodia barretti]
MGSWPLEEELKTELSDSGTPSLASHCRVSTPALRCVTWPGRGVPTRWSALTVTLRTRSLSGATRPSLRLLDSQDTQPGSSTSPCLQTVKQ